MAAVASKARPHASQHPRAHRPRLPFVQPFSWSVKTPPIFLIRSSRPGPDPFSLSPPRLCLRHRFPELVCRPGLCTLWMTCLCPRRQVPGNSLGTSLGGGRGRGAVGRKPGQWDARSARAAVPLRPDTPRPYASSSPSPPPQESGGGGWICTQAQRLHVSNWGVSLVRNPVPGDGKHFLKGTESECVGRVGLTVCGELPGPP